MEIQCVFYNQFLLFLLRVQVLAFLHNTQLFSAIQLDFLMCVEVKHESHLPDFPGIVLKQEYLHNKFCGRTKKLVSFSDIRYLKQIKENHLNTNEFRYFFLRIKPKVKIHNVLQLLKFFS